jgi:xanthine dehydrogenase small subunit
VEGINLPKELNIVQEAMMENYATQCGFCTPGFVVSLTGFALQKNRTTLNTCQDAISGNICRCTGYKSIEKAAINVDEKLGQKDNANNLAWLIKEGFIPAYFTGIAKKLAKLENKKLVRGDILVANGTDLYVRHADRLADEEIHLIANDSNLKGINFEADRCTIGASVTVTELLENEKLRTAFPKLKAFLKLVSSEQIRNMGTLGGNFVNASPIGDMSIFFLALDSELTIENRNGQTRQIPFQEFHQNYKVYDLKEDELIKSISFEVPMKKTYFNFEKVSKRTHLDIASVNAACKLTLKNDIISAAHFSTGGVAAIPKYLTKTNAFLIGKKVNLDNIKEAESVLQSEINPISDVRGAKEYKRLLAKQLFFAHFIELFGLEL